MNTHHNNPSASHTAYSQTSGHTAGYSPSAPPSVDYPPPPPPPQYVAPNPSGSYAPTGYPQATPFTMPTNTGAPNGFYPGTQPVGAPQGSASLPHPHTSALPPSLPQGTLQMFAAGGFSDIGSKIEPVPAATVTAANAGSRLTDLKRKFNELQRKRSSYHTRQAANGGVAAASALFTFGTSLLVQGPLGVHNRNRLQQIIRAMRECIEQINALRKAFSHTPGWQNSEKVVQCDPKAFSKALNRQELQGDL